MILDAVERVLHALVHGLAAGAIARWAVDGPEWLDAAVFLTVSWSILGTISWRR